MVAQPRRTSSRRRGVLAKLVTAPRQSPYAFCTDSQAVIGGPRHETLAAALLDRRLLRRRRYSAVRRRARVRRDRVRRSREAHAAGHEDHDRRARAGRRLHGAGRRSRSRCPRCAASRASSRRRSSSRSGCPKAALERPVPGRRRRRARGHHQLSRDGRGRARGLRVVVDRHGPRGDRHRVAATIASASSTTAIARSTR